MQTPVQRVIEIVQHAVAWNVEGAKVPEYTWQEMYKDLENLLHEEWRLLRQAVEGLAWLFMWMLMTT